MHIASRWGEGLKNRAESLGRKPGHPYEAYIQDQTFFAILRTVLRYRRLRTQTGQSDLNQVGPLHVSVRLDGSFPVIIFGWTPVGFTVARKSPTDPNSLHVGP